MVKRALHIGLAGPIDDSKVTAGMDAESVQKKVNAGAQKAHATGLYHVECTFFEPKDFAETLAELRKKLEAGTWDALIIGGGVRAIPSITPIFEQIVNASREAAPKTKMLFQMAPDDIRETLERGFEK